MAKPSIDDPSTWKDASLKEFKDMVAELSPEAAGRALDWVKANWIVEPGRMKGALRVRCPGVPSLQLSFAPGLDMPNRRLGHSALELAKQEVLLAAAEFSSLFDHPDLHDALAWALDDGLIAIAAEAGRDGKRTAEWAVLRPDLGRAVIEDPVNWVAGPYPTDRMFVEFFMVLTDKGRAAFHTGAADDAVRMQFGHMVSKDLI